MTDGTDREVYLLDLRQRARVGRRRIDEGVALRALGLRDDIHPRDVCASLWRDVELAHAVVDADRAEYGHTVLGPVEVDGGLLTVVDLRPAMAAAVRACGVHEELPPYKPTDPSLPDDYRGPHA